MPAGQVFLVGAGPGDPNLITLRGIQCLQRADAVLFDYLVNGQILKHARPGTELIGLGRHGGTRLWTQEEINARLVDLAREGKTVVRLKGGDPTVFAREASELRALDEAGIPFEIVPGITAALAAGSYAGIPVTHRDFASAVAFVTGQEHGQKDDSSLDFAALARFPGTLVFYMGVTTAELWTKALIQAGKAPQTPAAIIRRCSFPNQQTLRCRLDEVPRELSLARRVRPPAIVIVGDVAGLPERFNWFEQRPLFGQTILVTRPVDQAASLADRLAELGAEVLIQPAIEISEPPDWAPVDQALQDLSRFDWLVFSSANGVHSLLRRLFHLGADVRRLGGVKLAAMGPGTAEALSEYRLQADLLPAQFRAESLAEALAAQAPGRRFLLARASRGREVLAEQLTAAGGQVQQVVVYHSSDVAVAEPDVKQRLAEGQIDWVTITSSAIARAVVRMFGDALRGTRCASISPITSATLRESGLEPAAEAAEYTMDGVVQAIRQAVSQGRG